jgi:nitrile hydratase accessory protein
VTEARDGIAAAHAGAPGTAAPAPLDPAVAQMPGAAALPRRNGELVFDAPWQGRALAMALAVVERLRLPWSEFQSRLIAAIAARPDAPYYDCWVAALEALVVEHGVLSPPAITAACRRVASD